LAQAVREDGRDLLRLVPFPASPDDKRPGMTYITHASPPSIGCLSRRDDGAALVLYRPLCAVVARSAQRGQRLAPLIGERKAWAFPLYGHGRCQKTEAKQRLDLLGNAYLGVARKGTEEP